MTDLDRFYLFNDSTDIAPDESDPPLYRCSAQQLGPQLKATRLGMSVYDLPAGTAICPYHLDWTDEEWLIVIMGSPVIRTPSGDTHLIAGDVVCFPAGPTGAHQVRNPSDEPIRVALFSTKSEIGLAEYPDSEKIGIWVGDAHYMLRRSAHLDYWDGEAG